MKEHRRIGIIALLVGGAIFSCSGGAAATALAATEEVRMAGYTTYYDKNVAGRSENIRLAASFIDGVILQAYGEFSFNQTVGERSAQRGFQKAKVIVRGEYVQGIGGGVCQVSTTLYNAALYAGLEVNEYHPHTLAAGYVPPSQDAMVSSVHDLRLYNPYEFPVRFVVKTGEGAVRARIYGRETGKRIEVVSRTVSKTPPPEPLIVEGEKEEVLRQERWGLKSESYLETYEKGVLVSRKLLRKDAYAPTRALIVKKNL